jgi:hypothetical protein
MTDAEWDAALDALTVYARESLMDALAEPAPSLGFRVENVRQDAGNIAFEVIAPDGESRTRLLGWGLRRYADGRP